MVAATSSSSSTEQQPLTADSWWDVIPGRKEGVTPLFERCKRLLGWDDAYTTLVCTAYREFMECKVFVRDWDATKLSPSIPVDKMWHQHILDSKQYVEDCNLLFGRVIHHNPDGDIDAQARSIRIERTKALISTRNGQEILNDRAWDFGIAIAPTASVNNAQPPCGGPSAAADILLSRRRASSPLPLPNVYFFY